MNGLILLKKPKGMTSHDVVKRLRRFLPGEKIGHAGTLDPAACGLLLVCVGKVTKLTPFLQELDKVYRGKIIFGIVTSTCDEEGEVIEEKDASSLTRQEVGNIFKKFTGKILQVPPPHSALHFKGERLYNLARKGVEVEVSPREVRIYELKLLEFIPGTHPEAKFELRCSKGTYVRSLCRDVGRESGYGGYQGSLCRTKVGPFSIEEAKELEEVEKLIKEGKLQGILIPPAQALPHFPRVVVKEGVENFVKWGRPLYNSHFSDIPHSIEKGDRVRICSEDGRLLAVGVALQSGFHFSSDKVGFKYLRVVA